MHKMEPHLKSQKGQPFILELSSLVRNKKNYKLFEST